jgi:hypothetical protein
MRRFSERLMSWIRWVIAPGCWMSWSGLARGEELWIGDYLEQCKLPFQSEGVLWVGVPGICWHKRCLQRYPMTVSFRSGSAWYTAVLDFVPGRRYHIDVGHRQILFEGGAVTLVKNDNNG